MIIITWTVLCRSHSCILLPLPSPRPSDPSYKLIIIHELLLVAGEKEGMVQIGFEKGKIDAAAQKIFLVSFSPLPYPLIHHTMDRCITMQRTAEVDPLLANATLWDGVGLYRKVSTPCAVERVEYNLPPLPFRETLKLACLLPEEREWRGQEEGGLPFVEDAMAYSPAFTALSPFITVPALCFSCRPLSNNSLS